MGGTDAMQAAGELRLPRFEVEQIEDYAARLHSSWLFNGFKKTVKDMTGRVFEKPVEIADAPQQVIEWAENIDMQGRDLSAFAKEVFQDGFASGVSFIMADAPRRDAEATREQANTLGLRPYLVHLRVEDVLGWKTETYGNVLAFSQFRIMESYEYDDPRDEFMQVTGEQVRVLDSDESGVSVRIYRKDEGKNWVLFEQYPTDAQEITVVPYYAQRTGFATGEPVLEDLADVNLAHWRSQSDQTNVLHYARVPIVHVAGLEDGEVFKISANTAFVTRNHEAKVSWINFDDKAIKVGRQDLKDLEYQMQVMGLQLLVDGQRSATGSVLDAKKETSGLGMMADNLKDALEHALAWVADYGGLGEQSIGLVVNKDFGAVPLTAQEVTAMQKDVALGLLSREEYYEERKRRGVLRSDLDTEADIELVDNAEPDLGGGDGDE
ncbi:DUF4055 domain-containing protein [Tateyamaria sp.]|uniref:DUF4055 domain-containing protein n=1 Tax=Tateyamaria sp. TaxID=1929288 RepID=UPI003B216C60